MREVVIVMPERLVPGIRASICDRPIKMASFNVRSSTFFVLGCFVSAHQSTTPNMSVIQAITYIVLSQSGSNKLIRNPAIMTGMELIIMNADKRAFCVFIFPRARSLVPKNKWMTSRQKYTVTDRSVPTCTAMSIVRFLSSHCVHWSVKQ